MKDVLIIDDDGADDNCIVLPQMVAQQRERLRNIGDGPGTNFGYIQVGDDPTTTSRGFDSLIPDHL
jgi:hypothetical protein